MESPNDLPDGVTRRTTLKKGLLLSSSLAVGVPAVSGTVTGNPQGCDVLVDPTDSDADANDIQNGVAIANPGDTVCVNDGTYTQQVVINKDLTLTNSPGASPTIVAPPVASGDDLDEVSIPESDSDWRPVVFAFGGSAVISENDVVQVTGSGTVTVSVSGFTIDGAGLQPPDRSAGILCRNVRGTATDPAMIKSNDVENMGVGGKETFGIMAYGDSDLQIYDNDVREYERGGIGANGDGGEHPSPTVDIRGNTVTGSTGIKEAWGPNGIQIGYGATGQIKANDVSDNRWSSVQDGDWVASGIIVFESDDVSVMQNSVTNSDVGVASGAWAWFLPSADDTIITKNEIQDAHAGVLLQAVAWDGISTTDPSVSNAKVVNNTLSDSQTNDDDVGIAIDSIDLNSDYDPILWNNKVIRNSITGFGTQVDDDGAGTKVRAIEP